MASRPPSSSPPPSPRSGSSRRSQPREGRPVRLQRVLASAGIAARRAAERMIEEGRVQVNGETVATLPAFVDPLNDRISVDGRPLPKAAIAAAGGGKASRTGHVYIMLNKPARVLTVAADEPGLDRTTVMDLVKHPTAPRLFPAGRLGYETEGLVILTNDGVLVNRLTHPRYGVARTYRAVVKGALDDAAVAKLKRELARLLKRALRQRVRETGRVRPAQAGAGGLEIEIEKREADRTTLRVMAREGRTGDLGDHFAAAGVRIRKLERIAIGPVELTAVARGRWRELTRQEVQALRAATRPGAPAPVAVRGTRSRRRSEPAGAPGEQRQRSASGSRTARSRPRDEGSGGQRSGRSTSQSRSRPPIRRRP